MTACPLAAVVPFRLTGHVTVITRLYSEAGVFRFSLHVVPDVLTGSARAPEYLLRAGG